MKKIKKTEIKITKIKGNFIKLIPVKVLFYVYNFFLRKNLFYLFSADCPRVHFELVGIFHSLPETKSGFISERTQIHRLKVSLPVQRLSRI